MVNVSVNQSMIYTSEINRQIKMHSPTLSYAVKRIRLERESKLNDLAQESMSDDERDYCRLMIQDEYRRKLDLIVDKHLI